MNAENYSPFDKEQTINALLPFCDWTKRMAPNEIYILDEGTYKYSSVYSGQQTTNGIDDSKVNNDQFRPSTSKNQSALPPNIKKEPTNQTGIDSRNNHL